MKKFIILFLLIFASSSFLHAAEWSFYGNARLATWYEMTDEDAGDDDDLNWELHPNSRIGAKVTADDIKAGFEYGASGGKANIRKLYGTWDFGDGELTIGQTYTPLNFFISKQACACTLEGDDNLLPYGAVYESRHPLLQLKMGNLKLALVKPKTSDLSTGGDVDTALPKFEFAYHITAGQAYFDIFGGYQKYDIEAAATMTSAAVDETVDSFVYGLNFGLNVDALYVKTSVYLAQNAGTFAMLTTGDAKPDIINSELENVDTLSVAFAAGMKASDKLSFECGGGYINHESDAADANEDETMVYYINSTINLTSGAFVVPEIGIIDFKENGAGVSEGKATYVGAKWQINF